MMQAGTCGCEGSGAACGCCDGGEGPSPPPIWNRPGLPTLRDRAGTHGTFLATMKARLASMQFEAPGPDGQTAITVRPLQALTTRDASDPAVALLDGWATIADVLTFYQERISSEAYLRTAQERRSLVSLARTVGYAPRPGVAATSYLWYMIDPSQAEPVTIPAGSRAQSVPGPGETPQTFETADPLEARAEWNALPVRQTKPQVITQASAATVETVFFAGGTLNLKPGDQLLFVFDELGTQFTLRTVAAAQTAFAATRTEVGLVPLPKTAGGGTGTAGGSIGGAAFGLSSTIPGGSSVPGGGGSTGDSSSVPGGGGTPPAAPPGPDVFVAPLLKTGAAQPASAQRLGRNLGRAFQRDRDTVPQLLLSFVPQIRDRFYAAWQSAPVAADAPALHSVHVLRATASPFGATAGNMPTFDGEHRLEAPGLWTEWGAAGDEADNVVYLEQPNDKVLPGSFVVIQGRAGQRAVRRVVTAETMTRTAYGISGKATRLLLDRAWWSASQEALGRLRSTTVRAESEALTLAEAPIASPVDGAEIELVGINKELQPGRWLVLSGERTDIPGATGVRGRELAMLSGLRHGSDPTLPGDTTHTTLVLATAPAFSYRRETLVVSANVVRATHGETRAETLGAGSTATAFQSFDLKQAPLTFLAAPTPAGVATTLSVFVDGVAWGEADGLAGLGTRDRAFVTRIAADGKVTITFGDGVTGARLPTGVENVRASYRQGIGAPGNVRAGQISLLMSRPAGVRDVVNPLAGTGGADPESEDQIRENAPLGVSALDRVVSVQDYTDFTRGFAGIGKADARRVSDGRRQYIHITIAGADDIPIDVTADLYRNLLAALRRLGDPALPILVASRELVALVLSARVALIDGYVWEPVAEAVRAALLDGFGFARRGLGQPAMLSEAIALIQAVPGVSWVDVDAFGGVPERVVDAQGRRRVLTLDEIADRVGFIADPTPPDNDNEGEGGQVLVAPPDPLAGQVVRVAVAGPEGGAIRPAQLAIFKPDVPDTITLNQIL